MDADKMTSLLNDYLSDTDVIKQVRKFQRGQVKFDKSMKHLIDTMHQNDDALVEDFLEREYEAKVKTAQHQAVSAYDELVESMSKQQAIVEDELIQLEKGKRKIETLTAYQVRDFAKRRDAMMLELEKKRQWSFKRLLKLAGLGLLSGIAFGLGLALIYLCVTHNTTDVISLMVLTAIASIGLALFIADTVCTKREEALQKALDDPWFLAKLGKHSKIIE